LAKFAFFFLLLGGGFVLARVSLLVVLAFLNVWLVQVGLRWFELGQS
jgi:hypothetical protein